MELKINKAFKLDEITVGDIVVINSDPYLVRIDHGTGCTDALLLGLSGDKNQYHAYYNLDALKSNVANMDNVEHYKASEYELRLFKSN